MSDEMFDADWDSLSPLDLGEKRAFYGHDYNRGLVPLFQTPVTAPDEDSTHRWLMPGQPVTRETVDRLYQMLEAGEITIVPGMWRDRIVEFSLTPLPGSHDFKPKAIDIDANDDDDV